MLHEKASPEALGVLRIVVYAIWVVTLLVYPYERYAAFPFEWFHPHGPARFVPDAFWGLVLRWEVLFGLRLFLISLGLLLIAGIRPFGPLAFLFAVLVLILDIVSRALNGDVVHSELVPLYAAFALAFFPAADGLSFLRRRSSVSAGVYAAPLLLIMLAMAMGYSLIGLRRVAEGGIAIFTGDAIVRYMAVQSLNHSTWGFEWGLLPLTSAPLALLAKTGFAVTTLVEITSPLAVLHTAYRRVWLVIMLPFHALVLLTMNIAFWQNALLILVVFTGLPYWIAAVVRKRVSNPYGER